MRRERRIRVEPSRRKTPDYAKLAKALLRLAAADQASAKRNQPEAPPSDSEAA